MTTLKTVLSRLDALDDDFEVFSGAATPPSKKDVDAVEAELGVPLRPDHRALIAKLGSGAVVVHEAVWPRPVEFDVRPAWQFCFGVEIFGIAPETAPAVDVVVQSSARKPSSKKPFVAALRRIGERSCVGYDKTGKLAFWEPGRAPEPAPVDSLYDLLLGWIRELEADKERIKGDPPRSDAKRGAPPKGKKRAAKEPAEKTAERWFAELRDDIGDANEVGAELMKEPAELRGEVIALVREAISRAREGEDEDEREEEARDALWALARIEEDERAVSALVDTATNADGEVRKMALGILGALDGKPAAAAVALSLSLGDKDEKVVSEAAEALESYSDPSVIAPLAKALTRVQKNPRWFWGVTAGHIFTALGAATANATAVGRAKVVGILTANLDPKESRYAALPVFQALITMKKSAEGALPALERAAARKDPYLATLARHAISAITGKYGPHLAALETAAKSKDGSVKAVAESALRDAEMAAVLAAK